MAARDGEGWGAEGEGMLADRGGGWIPFAVEIEVMEDLRLPRWLPGDFHLEQCVGTTQTEFLLQARGAEAAPRTDGGVDIAH